MDRRFFVPVIPFHAMYVREPYSPIRLTWYLICLCPRVDVGGGCLRRAGARNGRSSPGRVARRRPAQFAPCPDLPVKPRPELHCIMPPAIHPRFGFDVFQNPDTPGSGRGGARLSGGEGRDRVGWDADGSVRPEYNRHLCPPGNRRNCPERPFGSTNKGNPM